MTKRETICSFLFPFKQSETEFLIVSHLLMSDIQQEILLREQINQDLSAANPFPEPPNSQFSKKGANILLCRIGSNLPSKQKNSCLAFKAVFHLPFHSYRYVGDCSIFSSLQRQCRMEHYYRRSPRYRYVGDWNIAGPSVR